MTEAKLMRYETAVIGGKAGEALQVSGTCAGVVVRVPSRATDQAEPMYDIQIGDTVIMHQVESDLRLQRGKRGKPDPVIRRMAHRSYNAFDAKGYERYRNRCCSRLAPQWVTSRSRGDIGFSDRPSDGGLF